MLESLRQAGKSIGRELNRAWENLSEGWRELLSRSGNALTHFARGTGPERTDAGALAEFPRWSLLAGEVEETDKDIVVRVEAPGMQKEDCRITIEGNMLYLSGEKRSQRETQDSTYHIMERAYGAFERSITLPRHVNADGAEATYRDGVLMVRLPKEGGEKSKTIVIN